MREINVFSVRNWATLHVIALMCIVLSAMSMATQQPIVQTEYHHLAYLHTTENGTQGTRPDQPLGTDTGTGTGIAGRCCNHTLIDIKVTVTIVHVEVIPDYTTDSPTEALPDTITPAAIITTVTHHTGNLHRIGAYQPTPEIAVGPDHIHHTNPVRTPHLNPHPDLVGQQ